jgi:hypothetical protein
MDACDHPLKIVPLSLVMFQLGRMIGRQTAAMPGSHIGVPIKLYDAMRIVFSRVAAP